MNTTRINELVNGMTSFRKEKYLKSELLPEYFNLQDDVIKVTFNEEHASTANLKIWDVENHLQSISEECGGAASEELTRFKAGCKKLCNLIKAEISGNRGESKAFRTLEYIKANNYILKNVELHDGDLRTELDAVVITPNMITIVEVKNTSRDIFIDENGNYYRTGEFLRWDSNIAEKMEIKKSLLRKVLCEAGFGSVEINSIVVFTDNRIQVQNQFAGIKTCFVSQLAYLIDEAKGNVHYSMEEMRELREAIQGAEVKEAYPVDFDIEQFKIDFATALVMLEEASAAKEEVAAENGEDTEVEKVTFFRFIKSVFSSKYVRYAGSTAAAVAITAGTAAILTNTVNKGGF